MPLQESESLLAAVRPSHDVANLTIVALTPKAADHVAADLAA